MDFLNQLIDNSQVPVITAFLLGLLTALSPCPLATNVTAVAYIARSCMDGNENNGNARRRVLWRAFSTLSGAPWLIQSLAHSLFLL